MSDGNPANIVTIAIIIIMVPTVKAKTRSLKP